MASSTTATPPVWGAATRLLQACLPAAAANPYALVVLVPLLALAASYLVSWASSPLKKYPGPALASWTNLWRMYHASEGSMHTVTQRMHERYGPVVRMAPNYLDLDYDACAPLIRTCFDTKGVWRKTEWHAVSGVRVGRETIYNVFSEVRPREHARLKRPVAKYWTTSAVARMEPHVDSAVAFFCRQLEARYCAAAGAGGEGTAGEAFDFGEWCMFFGWDAVAQTTMSRRLGYLDHGRDFDGTLGASAQAARYLVTVGMYPALDRLLDKNPVCRVGPPTFSDVGGLAARLLADRLAGRDGRRGAPAGRPDFTDHYIEAKAQNPGTVDDGAIIGHMVVNLAAGADTTASALRSVFYLCLKNPAVWGKLEAAVLGAPFARRAPESGGGGGGGGGGAQLPAPYPQARAVPYLEAVVRESLRLYPGNLFPQERYVPAGGLRLPDGNFVPEGTAVGFNAYVMHRNKEVWGADADVFRPERFLQGEDEPDGEFSARMRLYNDSDLSFGAGSRKCIGMNLGMMEVYKAVATLVAMFEWELVNEGEWEVKAELFPRATGIECRIRRREGMALRGDVGIDD